MMSERISSHYRRFCFSYLLIVILICDGNGAVGSSLTGTPHYRCRQPFLLQVPLPSTGVFTYKKIKKEVCYLCQTQM